ncbi:MAG: AMP-binding protein [Arenicella sp.]|nr:AMP-binding protein [Arenicella sp.]
MSDVLTKFNPNNHKNLVDAFNEASEKFKDQVAYHCLGDNKTYAEIQTLAQHFAAFLSRNCGLKRGDAIAIQLPNITQYPVAFWGAMHAGIRVVNTNPLYTKREQIHQFNDSGATALVVLDSLLATTEQVLPETKIETVIIASMTDLTDLSATPAKAQEFKNVQSFGFLETLQQGAELPPCVVEATWDDLAVLQYTGGTTGPSKGVMLSHGNVYTCMKMGRASVILRRDEDPEIALAPLPLYHIFGFQQHIIGGYMYGALALLIPNPRDMDYMIKTMRSYPLSTLNGVNTLLSGMMAHPDFDKIDFSHFVGAIAGGTTLVKEIAEEWIARTGGAIYEGYGLSESTGSGFCNRPESNELGTVGVALEHSEAMIMGENGESMPTGERGEVCLRGPHIMQGYWQRPEATAETIDEQGWLHTGDIGIFNERGHLKIVDRIKDMILVSGFNVYPNEVEGVVYSHPDVLECGAIGIPSEKTGEAIKLFVVSKSGQLTEKDIMKYCRQELAGYKVPKSIVFMQDLPKSPAGKVLRRELREAES